MQLNENIYRNRLNALWKVIFHFRQLGIDPPIKNLNTVMHTLERMAYGYDLCMEAQETYEQNKRNFKSQ